MLLDVDDVQLRDVLRTLDPPARNAIRRVLIQDQEYRDAMASRLLDHATDQAANLADLIDMLTLNNDARRTVVRLLGELEAVP
jgi:hypothetical protein